MTDDYYCFGCNKFVTRYSHQPNCEKPDVRRYRGGEEIERLGDFHAAILTDHYVEDD